MSTQNQTKANVYGGDCLTVLRGMESDIADLAYLDPPFFTQKTHRLLTRDGSKEFAFRDVWSSNEEYAEFLYIRLRETHRVLSQRGSLFVHCDRSATHIVRSLLDEICGREMFRSEIIWHYRRWSNSRKGLLPSHQTIYYYTKSPEYTFNNIWQEYSPATNVDQILQQRMRDALGKSTYKRDQAGNIAAAGNKKGVPLSDVWDIPYLNPKAKERTGYPTQKPLALMERIIALATNPGDLVLDPFCGSGTTLVAARLLERNAIGIDVSEDAVALTRHRLNNPVKSRSELLAKGRDSYRNVDESVLESLKGLEYVPVQRNNGIDAILKEGINGAPVPIRVQRENETTVEAATKLHKASKGKGAVAMFLIATADTDRFELIGELPQGVVVVDVPSVAIERHLGRLNRSS